MRSHSCSCNIYWFLRRRRCLLLLLLQGTPGGHFAAWDLRRIEELESSVCAWERQMSFLCDTLVVEPRDVISRTSQSAMSKSPDDLLPPHVIHIPRVLFLHMNRMHILPVTPQVYRPSSLGPLVYWTQRDDTASRTV